MEKAELKAGKHFSIEEKEAILSAIKYAKDYYNKMGPICKRATCPLLCDGLYDYLVKKYLKETYANRNYIIFNIRALNAQLFNKLKLLYHNPDFYISKGLDTNKNRTFWWSMYDKTSRCEALNILEQAIIND